MFQNVLAAATTVLVVLCASSSIAAPFVDIRAHWTAAAIAEFLPDGVSMSCRGDAEGSGDGCFGGLSLSRTVTAEGTYTLTSTGSLVATNNSDQTINGFMGLSVSQSAFNPGGPAVGVGIDDPLLQSARFRSSVTGPGAGDRHSCSVGFQGYSGYVISPTRCGVASPDSSFTNVGVDLVNFVPGAEVLFTYVIEIAATFAFAGDGPSGVPAPGGVGLLLTGVAFLARRRGRRPLD